jgi:uncharacterized membrane protein
MAAPTNRAATITRWVAAIVMCGLTFLLLGFIVVGYVLAIHHRLPPNDAVGFRDATTLSCLPAWYAGQQAGFSWLLLGGGPLLVLGIVWCVAAAMTRRSPWDVYVLSIGAQLLVVVVLVIAAVHADRVARPLAEAATCSPPAVEHFAPSFKASGHLVPVLVAAAFASVQILIGVLLISNWSRAANGQLQRNPNFGIRTPSTLRSEHAWMAGNRAALRQILLYLLAGGAMVVALFATALCASTTVVVVTGIASLATFFALMIYTAVTASRAARAADG